MLNKKIIVVDDEPDIQQLLDYNLTKEGCQVKTFSNPLKVIEHLQFGKPDLILSDWLMPDMDGLEFCRYLKMNPDSKDIPLIMITCKGDETDIVTALELGADDYLVKPFKIKELIVRIKKIIRSKQAAVHTRVDLPYNNGNHTTDGIIRFDGLYIDQKKFKVMLNDLPINLTISEFKLLCLLAENPGTVFTRDDLIKKLNGLDYMVTERAIDVKIVGLRKKLGASGKFIITVRSIGYKLSEEAIMV
jgi:DNA-binding response OmpR family regulator